MNGRLIEPEYDEICEAEYEQLRTEFVTVDPDRSMFVIAYALAAVSGSLFTVVCLGIGVWLRGLG